MDYKDKINMIIAKTGYSARSFKGIYGQANDRDRALIQIGMEIERSKGMTVKDSIVINNSNTVYNTVKKYFTDISCNEEIFALLLDNKNGILSVENVSFSENPSSCSLNFRKLLRAVLAENASGVILSHNHPSGNLSASSEDMAMTRKIKEILNGMGVELIDHIIATEETFSRVNF